MTEPRQRHNQRRAYDRKGQEIAPMDLASAAENGVRFIRAICAPPCRHEGQVPLAAFPSTMAVRDVGLYLHCLRAEGAGDRAGLAAQGSGHVIPPLRGKQLAAPYERSLRRPPACASAPTQPSCGSSQI